MTEYKKTGKRGFCSDCKNRRKLYEPGKVCSECASVRQAEADAKAAAEEKARKLKAAAKKGDEGALPRLGWTVFWTVREKRVPRADLAELLEKTIGVDYMPAEPRKPRAVRRALDELVDEGFVRTVDGDGQVAFHLVDETVDREHVDVTFDKHAAVVVDKATGALTYRGDAEEIAELESLIDKYQTVHTEADLRWQAICFLKANQGVTLRETGGVYFMPGDEAVAKLRRYVKGVGGEFYSLPVVDDAAARRDMAQLVKNELETQLTIAAEDLKQIAANPTKVQDATFERRAAEFRALRAKIEAYGDLLRIDADKMANLATGLEQEVLGVMTGQHAACPQSADYPYRSRVRYTGKGERAGKEGSVVGFPPATNKHRDRWVKVLFDGEGSIAGIAVSQLDRVDETAAKTA